MATPQSIADVERLADKLTRQGLIGGCAPVGSMVQYQSKGVTWCAQVKSLFRAGSGQRFMAVQNLLLGDRVCLPVDSCRACSGAGDGRCVCVAGATGGTRTARLRAGSGTGGAAPLGNTGTRG